VPFPPENLIGRLRLKWAFWGYALFDAGWIPDCHPDPFPRQMLLGRLLPGRGCGCCLPTGPGCIPGDGLYCRIGQCPPSTDYLFVYMQSLEQQYPDGFFALPFPPFPNSRPCSSAIACCGGFGARGMLLIRHDTSACGLICYSLTTNHGLVLVIQLCHGADLCSHLYCRRPFRGPGGRPA